MNYLYKLVITMSMILFFIPCVYGQQNTTKSKTTYEKLVSNTGIIVIKNRYVLPTLHSSYKSFSITIIEITSKGEVYYFLIISTEEICSSKFAIIAEKDLIKISKVLETIITKSEKELAKSLEHMEICFTTDDGFKIGYCQQGIEQVFFIELANYQSDDTYFFDNFVPLIKVINEAKIKIIDHKRKKE